jgi:hypothetical protein
MANTKDSKNHGLLCLFLIQAFDYATDDIWKKPQHMYSHRCMSLRCHALLPSLGRLSGQSGGKIWPLRKKSGPLTNFDFLGLRKFFFCV